MAQYAMYAPPAYDDFNLSVTLTVAQSTADAGFVNPIFCFFDTTYADYNPVIAAGLGTGDLAYTGYSQVSGGCIDLLTPGFAVGFE